MFSKIQFFVFPTVIENKINSDCDAVESFPALLVASLRNRRKVAAMNRDTYEDHPRNNQA